MKIITKILMVPAIALGLVLSGISFDATAATTCKNGVCKISKAKLIRHTRLSKPKLTKKTIYKRVYYRTYYGGGCNTCNTCGYYY